MTSAALRVAGFAATAVFAACGDDGGPPQPAIVDADPTAPDAMPREVIMSTQLLEPLMHVEGKMHGGPDDYAGIHLEAPFAKIGWNIHGHENGGTQTIHDDFDQMEVNFIFTPTSETDWWLLVRNDGQTAMEITVKVELYGGMTWVWE